jgi:hypothetical protein
MTRIRMTIPIDNLELAALTRVADSECRPPREQARYILRQVLIEKGLLSTDVQPKEAAHAAR